MNSHDRVLRALQGIIEIGKRDLSNPKYDPFFEEAKAALQAALPAVPEVLSADDVQWVVNDSSELGVMIRGQCFFLYKGESLVYEDAKHDDGTPMFIRTVGKREFGECCHPIGADISACGYPHRYGQVSVDDSDRWQPLPAATPAHDQPEGSDND